MTTSAFRTLLSGWYRIHGRHDLPWRKTRDPYRILMSEIMLQQTQVSRVREKYRKLLAAFPTIAALDRAPLGRVLALWQGMGYNRRAVHLKRMARRVMAECGGRIPDDPEALKRLPGIGPATAGAVAAFAFGKRVAFLETNIRRAYLHCFFPHRRRVRDHEILRVIRRTLPRRNIREWYYAIMDYGAAALKGIPNPNRSSAHYTRQPPFHGSRRELRGRILASLTTGRTRRIPALQRRIGRDAPAPAFRALLKTMQGEGLIAIKGARVSLPAAS